MTSSITPRYLPLIDVLESRTVPAGNVTASLSHGILTIAGDTDSNQISIVASGEHGVTISAVDSSTTINGSSSSAAFDRVRGITASMGDGNDLLTITGVKLHKQLSVDMGAGDDNLTIDGVRAGKHSTLDLGTGNDTAAITDSYFKSRFQLLGKDDNDAVNITGTKIGEHSTLDGGPGTDSLTQSDNKIRKHSSIINWESTSSQSPTAAADSATVIKGGDVTVNVASNDTTPSGTIDLTSIAITTQPAHGTVTVNTDGTVKYTHGGGSDTTDSLAYTIKNSAGVVSNAAIVSLTIDQGPTANNDTATVAQGGNITIPVSTNDTAAFGTLDLTSLAVTTNPTHGTVTVNNDGTIKYTHDNSATTSDTFAYTIKDSLGAVSSPATVNITITA